jgi:predicted nucleotidyltransferase component of viral defense system
MMILSNPKDAIHKAWLYRLLSAISDNQLLASTLYFKGGTCAAMLGWLNRFSVDLDFDCNLSNTNLEDVKKNLESVFKQLGLEIKDQSQKVPQYFLKYETKKDERNTIKVDALTNPPLANKYQQFRLNDIDRIFTCQTIETMFANKLVAVLDRFEKNNSIAGRDLYDIHHFFLQGYEYDQEVIQERRKDHYKNNENILSNFFQKLILFIEKKITETTINQDLNFLLPLSEFKKIRKILKPEVLRLLRDELVRLKKEV